MSPGSVPFSSAGVLQDAAHPSQLHTARESISTCSTTLVLVGTWAAPLQGVIGGPLLLALWLVAVGDDQILSFMHMMFLYLAKLSWKAVLEALLNQDR